MREITPVASNKLNTNPIAYQNANVLRGKNQIKPSHDRLIRPHFRSINSSAKRNATQVLDASDSKKYPLFSKESVNLDINRQNLAAKPCLQASPTALMQGKLEFKAHGFHQK